MRRIAAFVALVLALSLGESAAQPARHATTTTQTATVTATTSVPSDTQAPGATGSDLPAAVAEEQITVSSDYRGSAITVFGVNPDRRGRGDIVVVVRGPNVAATVMRKRRVLGLWVNGDPVRFSAAPAFFAVLSTRPLRQIASPQEIYLSRLDPSASIVLGSNVSDSDPSQYKEALVRLRRAQGLYSEVVSGAVGGPNAQSENRSLRVLNGGLFRAVVFLPANAPIAEYHADTYLFRNGQLVSSARVPIRITRVGFERQIHDLAAQASFLYGLLTVGVALIAGWIAAFWFRRG